MSDRKIVTFLDADGNEVSNDPEWLAKQEVQRFEDTVSEPDAAPVTQGVDASGGSSSEPTLDDYSAKQLKEELGKRREAGRVIDTKGIKDKAGLLAALKADDAAREDEEAADDEDDESEDDDDSEDNSGDDENQE